MPAVRTGRQARVLSTCACKMRLVADACVRGDLRERAVSILQLAQRPCHPQSAHIGSDALAKVVLKGVREMTWVDSSSTGEHHERRKLPPLVMQTVSQFVQPARPTTTIAV